MTELDPGLHVALLQWREAMRLADKGDRPEAERAAIRDRSIWVFVRTELDDAALAGLGLSVLSRSDPFIIGSVALVDAERLATAPGITSVLLDRPLRPQLDDTVPQIRAPTVWNGSPSFKGRKVIVGIVDTGIDIFHESFRQADLKKTRILSIWDQNASGPGAPAPFTYGSSICPRQLKNSSPIPTEISFRTKTARRSACIRRRPRGATEPTSRASRSATARPTTVATVRSLS